jgi:predicted O-methyltransferase YrrM
VLLEIAREAKRDLPLVDAEVGALLRVLATAVGATRILEIGTAIGCSGDLARRRAPGQRNAGDDGEGSKRAAQACENFARGPVSPTARQRHDRRRVANAGKVSGPFDLIFQDGDKPSCCQCSIGSSGSFDRTTPRHRQRALGRRGRARIHPAEAGCRRHAPSRVTNV